MRIVKIIAIQFSEHIKLIHVQMEPTVEGDFQVFSSILIESYKTICNDF